MGEEMRYTKQDLETMRAWPLERKIRVTQTRLMEWKMKFKGKIYISFSGGKDSTVLADLAARIYKADKQLNPDDSEPLTLVFVNTGLEYPEIQKFVKVFAEWLRTTYEIPVNLEILHPAMTFPEVLTKYGYPVIAKETSKVVYYARRGSKWAINRLDGLDKHGNKSDFKERFKKYKFLKDAPFESSPLCCDVISKAESTTSKPNSGSRERRTPTLFPGLRRLNNPRSRHTSALIGWRTSRTTRTTRTNKKGGAAWADIVNIG